MSRIQVLPDKVINQIAAGEVIERPASVVKELIENALDAGARSVAIAIEGGGRRRIRVADDGCGLDADDAVLAFERHATSKLSHAADLNRITTLGFRGEALPAISSVSRLTLQTSCDGRSGTRVGVEAGRIVKVSDVGHPRGTTLDVRDLFFNTPARAKFLRTASTELAHISDRVAACAVAAPQTRITLSHEGRRLLEAPPAAGPQERLAQVFGAEWRDAIPFVSSRGALAVRGLIVPPGTSSLATRRMQHVYVNARPVRDRLIGHAIAGACEEFFPRGRHAALFLFVCVPPEAVDVNVHPAKAEVRFGAPQLVHQLVREALASALRRAMPVTPMGGAAGSLGSPPERARPAGSASQAPPPLHEATLRYLDQPREDATHEATRAPGPAPAALEEGPVALAHYRQSYILAADGRGLLVVDQHAAHERILFERLLREAGCGADRARQALLFPVTVGLPLALVGAAGQTAEALDRLGFSAEPFGEETLLVRAAPALLEAADPASLVRDLLEQLSRDDAGATVPEGLRRERLLATVACHAAVKARMPLTVEKMNYLIRELFRTTAPLKCPHGRPSVVRFSHQDIERSFDRR